MSAFAVTRVVVALPFLRFVPVVRLDVGCEGVAIAAPPDSWMFLFRPPVERLPCDAVAPDVDLLVEDFIRFRGYHEDVESRYREEASRRIGENLPGASPAEGC